MKNEDIEAAFGDFSVSSVFSQSVSLTQFQPHAAARGLHQLLNGLGEAFLGMSHLLFQADDHIKPPPKKMGEYHEADYRDTKKGFERTKDGKKAECKASVYIEYGRMYVYPVDSCDKITALELLVAINHVEHEALEKAPEVCKDLKDCPNADVALTYAEWFCAVHEAEIEEEKDGKKQKVKANRAHLGIRAQVKVTCRA